MLQNDRQHHHTHAGTQQQASPLKIGGVAAAPLKVVAAPAAAFQVAHAAHPVSVSPAPPSDDDDDDAEYEDDSSFSEEDDDASVC